MTVETFMKDVDFRKGYIYSEKEIADLLNKFGEIKWKEAQKSAMEANRKRGSFNLSDAQRSPLASSSSRYPVGTFTPYNKD